MPYTDNPQSNPLDAVRLEIGDTSTTAPYLTDNAVAYFLSKENGSVLRAAASAAESLSAKFASTASEKRVGPLTLIQGTRARTRSQEFADLARLLWRRAAVAGSAPFAGGISVADKNLRVRDPDRVKPAIRRQMMSYPLGQTQSMSPEEILSTDEPTV